MILRNDLALLSLGDLSRRSLLIRYGLPADASVASLRKAGAVGDLMGQFLDGAGRPVEPRHQHAACSRRRSTSCAGFHRSSSPPAAPHKTRIVAAVLRARLASVLVCDEATAVAALRLMQ